MTNVDTEGRRCLSFTVDGPWAHFRRIDTTTDKQTYRVMPRTTVAGLIAAILGRARDSYYETFDADSSAIAIEPTQPVRTMQVPMLTLPTTENEIQQADGVSGKTLVPPEVLEAKRQRRSFEYLRDAAFRVHVVLTDDSFEEELADRLGINGDGPRPVYTPYLGKSECLAEVRDVEENTVEAVESADTIDSIVPEDLISPQPGVSYSIERTPQYMTWDGDGRKTTQFLSYAYPPDGDSVQVSGVPASQVGESTVCFI
ncbi:type I-B CRISPR-associated protein Cas5b [Halapricum desulfuricans]|uniref:CRISPR-Cas system related protein Cas5, RAMP superfamily n=1 Tax=Halapricum desulfuricans TaxID=2841257 RepID=A0A897MZY6_9EURY|nr:type I-B CRISPR-associated protein Cas5b [Halapricum desulfuricans]QSG06007.1 CRISPR-Cas system related protein Cas5, RAMP superfamily [Halapricum desulfuricans]